MRFARSGVWVAVLVGLATAQNAGTVRTVGFQGNRTFARRVLAGMVAVKVNEPTSEAALDRDAALLRRFYQEHGFFEVQVQKGLARVQDRQVVTFSIDEGPRTRIGAVEMPGSERFSAGQLLAVLPTRPGMPFTRQAVVDAEAALKGFYLDSGHPFARVEGSFTRVETVATVVLAVAEGPRCYIGALRVRGNATVATATVLRAAEIRVGERYSQQRLRLAQRRLYATRLFRRVLFYVSRADSSADSVTVRFDVEEQPCRGFAFGVGFQTSPSRALLSLEWEHDNVFNRAQVFQAGAELSPDFAGDYRVGLDATYRVPYFVTTRHDLQFHPFFYWEKVDTLRQREYGIETGLSRELLPQLQVGLLNRLRLVADTASGVTNSLALNAAYDARDDILDTRRGLYLQAGGEVAGGLLAGDNDFYRASAEARLFRPLFVGFGAAARVMAGRVFPYGRTDRAPYYEEYSLGGRNSLRGYPDRAIGPDTAPDGQKYGPYIVNASVELRTPYLFNWVGLVGFGDCGHVTGRGPLRVADLAVTAGLGVRVKTPIGPVRLDWGRRLKDPPAGDNGRFYFGVLQAF